MAWRECGQSGRTVGFRLVGTHKMYLEADLLLIGLLSRAARGIVRHLSIQGLETGTWEPCVSACYGSRLAVETGEGYVRRGASIVVSGRESRPQGKGGQETEGFFNDGGICGHRCKGR
jgi:hypothetical protein